MTESGGEPLVGPDDLGARLRLDLTPDSEGLVHPGTGGTSLAPDTPENLYRLHRPAAWGGDGTKPVWSIRASSIPDGLQVRHDPKKPASHALLEPSRTMTFEEYEEALSMTSTDWEMNDG